MSEIKERLYEAIDAVYEADMQNGVCHQDQIRLGKLSDGRIKIYLCDCMGDYSVELDAAAAGMLYTQLSEALNRQTVPHWSPPAIIPYVTPNIGTGSSTYYHVCPGCGKWVTGNHICVTCKTDS